MGLFGKRPPPRQSDADLMVERLGRHVDEAEARYLETLRREIANLLIESDPDMFDRVWRKASAYEREMADARPDRVEADEAALVAKYRSYEDFEILGLIHCVAYRERERLLSDDALADRYLDICRMLMRLRRHAEFKPRESLFGEREREAWGRARREALDGRLRRRMDAALSAYRAFCDGYIEGTGHTYAGRTYQGDGVTVTEVPSSGYGTRVLELVFDDGQRGRVSHTTGVRRPSYYSIDPYSGKEVALSWD